MSEELDLSLRDLTPSDFEGPNEELLIATLAQRVAYMLDHQPDLLFSTLYRLDVLEHKINTVLDSGEDPSVGISRLIVERQKEKLKTRSQWRTDWSMDDND